MDSQRDHAVKRPRRRVWTTTPIPDHRTRLQGAEPYLDARGSASFCHRIWRITSDEKGSPTSRGFSRDAEQPFIARELMHCEIGHQMPGACTPSPGGIVNRAKQSVAFACRTHRRLDPPTIIETVHTLSLYRQPQPPIPNPRLEAPLASNPKAFPLVADSK